MATNNRHGYFQVPPGTANQALAFSNLVNNASYRMLFTVTGNANSNLVLRPGGSAATNDIVLENEGQYNVEFTVDKTGGGDVRFLYKNVTGVTRVDITGISIFGEPIGGQS